MSPSLQTGLGILHQNGGMSDAPRGEGWWRSDDGEWYPPDAPPAPPPPATAPKVDKVPRHAAGALAVGIGIAVFGSFFVALAAMTQYSQSQARRIAAPVTDAKLCGDSICRATFFYTIDRRNYEHTRTVYADDLQLGRDGTLAVTAYVDPSDPSSVEVPHDLMSAGVAWGIGGVGVLFLIGGLLVAVRRS
jgi:Protein of unknown function (DUF3592)